MPKNCDVISERGQCQAIGWHGVIGEIASDDLSKPFPCFRDWPVCSLSQRFLDLPELRTHAFRRDFLLIRKSPRRDLSHMSTKPRNLKVSGLERPRLLQFCAAKRPNSIRRVFSG